MVLVSVVRCLQYKHIGFLPAATNHTATSSYSGHRRVIHSDTPKYHNLLRDLHRQVVLGISAWGFVQALHQTAFVMVQNENGVYAGY